MKILLVSSAGGHFKQLMKIKNFLKNKNWQIKTISVKNEDTKDKSNYFITEISRNPIKLIKNKLESFKLIKKIKPNLIISTGAGTTLFCCIYGKIFRSKIIYVESISRVENLSLTGKIIYKIKIADKFLVQWPGLIKKYPKAEYWGEVI